MDLRIVKYQKVNLMDANKKFKILKVYVMWVLKVQGELFNLD